MIVDGKAYDMPWEAADQIATQAKRSARKAEEFHKANRVIADNALMHRAGFRVGLSDDPKINAETVKESLYNRTLRRFLPSNKAPGLGAIQSRGVVGTPSLVKRGS